MIGFNPQMISKLRKKKKMTQEQLGQKAGVTQEHISRLESGQKVPSLKTLEKISIALEVPMSLLFYTDEKELYIDEDNNYAMC